jgi:hypothetical protein
MALEPGSYDVSASPRLARTGAHPVDQPSGETVGNRDRVRSALNPCKMWCSVGYHHISRAANEAASHAHPARGREACCPASRRAIGNKGTWKAHVCQDAVCSIEGPPLSSPQAQGKQWAGTGQEWMRKVHISHANACGDPNVLVRGSWLASHRGRAMARYRMAVKRLLMPGNITVIGALHSRALWFMRRYHEVHPELQRAKGGAGGREGMQCNTR